MCLSPMHLEKANIYPNEEAIRKSQTGDSRVWMFSHTRFTADSSYGIEVIAAIKPCPHRGVGRLTYARKPLYARYYEINS
jgi:hypothetical protein